MSSKSSLSSSFAKIIIFLLIVAAFLYLIYWLWQRQPHMSGEIPQTKKSDQVQSNTEDKDSTFDPKDGSILKDPKINLKGKVSANSYVAVNSNDFQSLTKSNEAGTFEYEIELSKGLNIFEITDYSQDLTEREKKIIIFYLSNDKEKITGDTVFAGSAKNIFDNLLTIGTWEGERKTRATKTTSLIIPQEEEDTKKEATASALSGVRIGDFVIALGKRDKESILTAEKLEVIRENKPQLKIKLTPVSVVADFKSGTIRGKDTQGKMLEFSTAKATAVFVNGQKAKNEEIKKDRKAVVFFEEGDKKVVLKIFLI